ncbi:MAG: DNA-primase RepB domain-containing protein [Sphingobium sp.]|uniref:DNA-primase RepB domain-containing protein n=1 Tax=Sphingobium sp. TaxID=1912891 RepID=UPI0029ACA100|nr:DNA-primase RepB domain-containing protein [Sphingobium sp.]MDX3911346.1 DNA-primase RepB domain-containing protein [Sphingobium sp.]
MYDNNNMPSSSEDEPASNKNSSGIGSVRLKPLATTAPNLELAAEVNATTESDGAGEVPLQGGKGGEAQSPPLPPSNAEFVAAVMSDRNDGARAAVCSIAGEPRGNWEALAAVDIDRQCPSDHNNYLNCSSFTPDEDGRLRARTDSFSGCHFLLLDDVGTKVDPAKLDDFTPTWAIETSPGNSQWGICFAEPIEAQQKVIALQSAIVAAGLSDPGSKGVARWARLPYAINGKAKHRDKNGLPFRCRLTGWNPDMVYTIDSLAEALSLDLSPPLPSFARPEPGKRATRAGEARGDDIYTPQPVENPVITALKEGGMYKRQIEPGKHDITCPWTAEHTDGDDSGAAYFEPTEDFAYGGFRCQHSHGDRYHVGELLDFVGIDRDQARGKARIRLIGGELNRVVRSAEIALTAVGDFYQSGGVIMAIRTDPTSGEISTEVVNEQMLQTALSDAALWERRDGKASAWVRCDPPTRVVQSVLKAGTFRHLPVLNGLARQPFFRESDGVLVMQPGYDPVSGIYAAFNPAEYRFPDLTREAAVDALADLNALLGEFHFPSEADRSAALSAILTATVRPSLPFAPAFNITASTPGTGKSYLARTIIPFGSTASAQTVGYPATAEEASKSMLATLLQGPAAIVFDDMQTDWKPFAVMNRMLTSETITERILGVSRAATVSTRSLILGTGNNIGPVGDMSRRVITIRLYAQTSNPATLSYKGRPAQEVAADRGKFVSSALTIVRAWMAAGKPRADVPDIASYDGLWSDYCRQPLLWLGQADPAISLVEQVQDDPYLEPLGYLLEAWDRQFGDQAVTVRKLVDAGLENTELAEALEDLPGMAKGSINRSSLGWFLKKNVQRIVNGMEIRPGESSERRAWRVVRVPSEGGKGG